MPCIPCGCLNPKYKAHSRVFSWALKPRVRAAMLELKFETFEELHRCTEENPTCGPACRLYGLGACSKRGLLIAGDTRGCLHLGDVRAGKAVGRHQVHKKGNKARPSPKLPYLGRAGAR